MAVVRFSFEDRVRIQVGWSQGLGFGELAELVGRPFATVYREVARNHSGRHGPKNPLGVLLPPGRRGLYRWGYDARWAQRKVGDRAKRPRPSKLKTPGLLRNLVLARLRMRWSPEQIAGWLRREFPDRPELWVSHETIYRSLSRFLCKRVGRGS